LIGVLLELVGHEADANVFDGDLQVAKDVGQQALDLLFEDAFE